MLETIMAVGKLSCGYVYRLSDLLYTACSVDMLILWVTLWISLI
jgi:hypothetical protein